MTPHPANACTGHAPPPAVPATDPFFQVLLDNPLPIMIKHLLLTTTLVLATATQAFAAQPQRFVIERDMPGASKLSADQLREASRGSNRVLKDLGPDIQWVHSYVAGDKIYCVYQAPSEALIREHARRTGLPANRITPVSVVIDPTTAN